MQTALKQLQDCEDSNPLIRALAVRTMGCIRVDKITEYLCEPLRKCLKDEDPYVRKTAAVCVAKLYDISSSMVEDQVRKPFDMIILGKKTYNHGNTYIMNPFFSYKIIKKLP